VSAQEGPRVGLTCHGCKHHESRKYRVQSDTGYVHRCAHLDIELGDLFPGDEPRPVAACPFRVPVLMAALAAESRDANTGEAAKC
jgi:hypothetical protein